MDEIIYELNTSEIYELFKSHFQNCKNILIDLEYPHPLENHYFQGVMADFGGFPYSFAEKLFDHMTPCGREPCQ